MLTINIMKKEAIKIRDLIEGCDKENTCLVIDCFPIMSCKLSSMLLSYHFLNLWPELEIKGVSAATGKNSEITHYWIEIDNVVVDITGDQYNLIDDDELNHKIIKNRPFPAVYVAHKKESYLHKIFKIRDEEFFVHGFPTVSANFIEKMATSHRQLFIKKTNTI